MARLSVRRSDRFGFDATTSHFYLHTDLRMRCYEAEHSRILPLAAAGIALWPVGVPLLFAGLVRAAGRAKISGSNRSWAVLRGVGFLHSGYRCGASGLAECSTHGLGGAPCVCGRIHTMMPVSSTTSSFQYLRGPSTGGAFRGSREDRRAFRCAR